MDHASSLSSALLRETQDEEGVEVDKVEENSKANKPSTSLVKPRTFKIIVLGESGVGKTCLSFRFCAGKFPLMTEATIGLDFREKVRTIVTVSPVMHHLCSDCRVRRRKTETSIMGHSRPGEVQEIYHPPLLPKRQRRCLCVRRHQRGKPSCSGLLVGRSEEPRGSRLRPKSAGWQQVRSGEQDHHVQVKVITSISGRPGGNNQHGAALGGRSGDASL